METLLQDLKYAIRMLRKNPGFTVVAVLALTLGIGANTAIFSVLNVTLLRQLPFPNPDELMVVGENNPQVEPNRLTISPGNYIDYRNQNKSFQNLAVYRITSQTGFNLSGAGVPERVAGASIRTAGWRLLYAGPANKIFGGGHRPRGWVVLGL